jgi:hypothetical protein
MNLLSINNVVGVLAQTRGGAAVGVAIGEKLAIALCKEQDVQGRYTVPQIAAALADINMTPSESECIAFEAVAAARAGF